VIDAWPVLAKGFDDPFEAGMVMAVEPKMGIPGVGMVGVENTFEVTSSGGVCLTGSDFGIIALE
jgi:Xaa-Pro aminopeptidase